MAFALTSALVVVEPLDSVRVFGISEPLTDSETRHLVEDAFGKKGRHKQLFTAWSSLQPRVALRIIAAKGGFGSSGTRHV